MEFNKIKSGEDTVCAISTPPGKGGVSVVRISGPDSLSIFKGAWRGKDISSETPRHSHFGKYVSLGGEVIDEVVATYFKSPASFTGEDTVEISMHGSLWIQNEILSDLIRRGARIAQPGEFTQRAFLNGKIDLAQAEGVADLIASDSKASHRLALSQMKGDFSKELEHLRNRLIEFASLLELELDFSEEDVEFADRYLLWNLSESIIQRIERLASSFSVGNVMKNGVPVVIAGIPNAGKSSLLNLICGDEKAIVTDIPGTTRDIIEDKVEINGISYRFIDTAGLHNSTDKVESIGISKARETIDKAQIVIWVFDPTGDREIQMEELNSYLSSPHDSHLIVIQNKSDLVKERLAISGELEELGVILFSTKTSEGLDELKSRLHELATTGVNQNDVIVTNIRHFEALTKSAEALKRARVGLKNNLSADFIAQDIREAIHHLGTITGSITTDDLLHNIFSHFCIGK